MASSLNSPQGALLPDDATATDGIHAWVEMENACQSLLLAGLRREVGPKGDVDAAYRTWYENYEREQSKAFVTMCENFARRQKTHG